MDSPNSRKSTGFGIVGLQTDDTLILADTTFAESEEIELRKAQFLAKDREKLIIKKPLKFNGSMVKLEPDRITLIQETQCIKLSLIDKIITQAPSTLKDRYIAERARDVSFANNKDLSSQIGYVIVLADKGNASNTTAANANIVHWSSIKCKRVTRSVLASELYAITYGLDIAFAIKLTLD
ncbi:uncharacterized protein KD926_010611 [Aspergillus affinis]|uniref:uncharacterized protein n=1 Tax=Aspergillus affinis TaxID=1070780 RepID=UPI0022FDF05F|nr:uncharacterized protein KD926_010611 [Aspergillus affinis]KAI9038566.1 hypothetical protein KD926_010611 [Aspergillus affinis]